MAFKQVFYAVINSKNIQINFEIIRFISYNFNQMFDYLDFKFYIFTSLNTFQWNLNSINLSIFYITKNVLWNFVNLKSKIVKCHNNSFIHLYKLINTQIKNMSKLMHKMVLLEIKNKKFYTTNELFNKWKKTKKMCVWIKRLFNVQKTNALQFVKIEINQNKSNKFENKIYIKKMNCTYNIVIVAINLDIIHKFMK